MMNEQEEAEFKKQFPGIANQGWQILTQVISYDRVFSTDDKKMIIKHCLDKQRVKEAFKRVREKQPCPEDALYDLWLELGVE